MEISFSNTFYIWYKTLISAYVIVKGLLPFANELACQSATQYIQDRLLAYYSVYSRPLVSLLVKLLCCWHAGVATLTACSGVGKVYRFCSMNQLLAGMSSLAHLVIFYNTHCFILSLKFSLCFVFWFFVFVFQVHYHWMKILKLLLQLSFLVFFFLN